MKLFLKNFKFLSKCFNKYFKILQKPLMISFDYRFVECFHKPKFWDFLNIISDLLEVAFNEFQKEKINQNAILKLNFRKIDKHKA